MVKNYKFNGYQNYENYRIEIKKLVQEATRDEDMRYYLAINEAVCNAAKYSIEGVLEAEISIRLRIEKNSIQTLVSSKTKPFDVRKHRDKFRNLAKDPDIKIMDWGDYTHEDISGRGFWYMLNACDFIYVNEKCQQVLLFSSLPISEERKNRTHVGQLVTRFHVNDGEVMII